jgi:chloramphenicol O-acetyltransferase type A
MYLQSADTVPRFAWGKFFKEGENLKMPLSVQAHHALMDGIHMGKYYKKVQDYLRQPDFLSG